ncbi:hypothetical protein MMC34_006974 [Xylographa carneopallida]|nr:hypothetical protein [Xylographa carneopallida]
MPNQIRGAPSEGNKQYPPCTTCEEGETRYAATPLDARVAQLAVNPSQTAQPPPTVHTSIPGLLPILGSGRPKAVLKAVAHGHSRIEVKASRQAVKIHSALRTLRALEIHRTGVVFEAAVMRGAVDGRDAGG